MSLSSKMRRNGRLNRLPRCFSSLDWDRAIAHFKCSCAYCGRRVPYELLTRDHFIATTHPRCPGTVVTNIVPACLRCNTEKSDRDPAEYLAEKYGETAGFAKVVRIVQYFKEVENSDVNQKRYR